MDPRSYGVGKVELFMGESMFFFEIWVPARWKSCLEDQSGKMII